MLRGGNMQFRPAIFRTQKFDYLFLYTLYKWARMMQSELNHAATKKLCLI